MNFLLDEQHSFDILNFDPPEGYRQLDRRDQKTRHILEHTAGAIGKLAIMSDDAIRQQVMPDLAIYRSQLMNEFNISPSEVETNSNPGADLTWKLLARSLFHLKEYIEPREHNADSDIVHIFRATVYMHDTALNLANHYGVDLEVAHLQRMESQLGKPLP